MFMATYSKTLLPTLLYNAAGCHPTEYGLDPLALRHRLSPGLPKQNMQFYNIYVISTINVIFGIIIVLLSVFVNSFSHFFLYLHPFKTRNLKSAAAWALWFFKKCGAIEIFVRVRIPGCK